MFSDMSCGPFASDIDVPPVNTGTGTIKAIVRYESGSGSIVFHEVAKSSDSKLHLVFGPLDLSPDIATD
jgi:hypothetical protein